MSHPRPVRIALDAMGGDAGAEVVVAGAARLSLQDPHTHVLLCGEVPRLRALLGEVEHEPARLELVPADGCVPMAGDAAASLDTLPRASVAVAADLVAHGGADALVSAGHTGATILAAARRLRRLPGVRRAALAAVYPTESRRGPRQDPFGLLLDVGATLGAGADDLVCFAVMGSEYARLVTEVERPRVALLSNGAEPNRGTPEVVEAHRRLRHHPTLNFIGNVEGIDIPKGTADVVVCDGFLGNIVLKMFEGMAETLVGLLRDARDQSVLWRLGLGLVGQDLREIKRVTDWKQYGGAPLLGLDRVVIKAHGRSNPRAVRNALKLAAKAVRSDLCGRIERGVAAAGEPAPTP